MMSPRATVLRRASGGPRWSFLIWAFALGAACDDGGAVGPQAARPEPPPGTVEVKVLGIGLSGGNSSLILSDQADTTFVVVGIDVCQANSISLGLTGQRAPRPLTHDFIVTLLGTLGAELLAVSVDSVVEGTYIATAHITRGGDVSLLDARPSDAIGVAVRTRSPVYLARALLESEGVTREELFRTVETLPF